MSDSDIQAARTTAVLAAKRVGPMLREKFGVAGVRRLKDDHAYSVVTDEDVLAEERIREVLTAFDPTIPIVGEELGGETLGASWLIDPIDGTGHFVRGMPFSTTMIALVEGPDVLAAVIYDFLNDAMYSAVAGGGATCNEDPIRVIDRPMSSSYVFYDFDLRVEGHPDCCRRWRTCARLWNS